MYEQAISRYKSILETNKNSIMEHTTIKTHREGIKVVVDVRQTTNCTSILAETHLRRQTKSGLTLTKPVNSRKVSIKS